MEEIIIKGNPISLKRHRHSRWGTYDPSKKDKKEFREKTMKVYEGKTYTQAIRVGLSFGMKRPKSHYRSGKYSHLLKHNAPEFHTKTPDVDNLAKSVLDALQGEGGCWIDDSIITSLWLEKHYTDKPCTEIFIQREEE